MRAASERGSERQERKWSTSWRRPTAVVMENVERLASRGAAVLRDLVERLEAAGYRVHRQVLSPEQYGCPQRRRRLFLVALRGARAFAFPPPIPLEASCLDALLPDAEGPAPPPWMERKLAEWDVDRSAVGLWSPNYHGFQARGHNPRAEPKLSTAASPCLVAKQPGLLVNHERRLLRAEEALWLQGFDAPPPLPRLSDAQVRRLAGNAMNVAVLTHLLASVLAALGLPAAVPPPLPPLRDVVRARTRSAPPPPAAVAPPAAAAPPATSPPPARTAP